MSEFRDLLVREPALKIYFSGCSDAQSGGEMGWGFIIHDEAGATLAEEHGHIAAGRDNSPNCAEYIALWEAFRWLAKAQRFTQPITVYGNSKLVINQMEGTWGVRKGGHYVKHYVACARIAFLFDDIEYELMPAELNSDAIWLAKTDVPDAIDFQAAEKG